MSDPFDEIVCGKPLAAYIGQCPKSLVMMGLGPHERKTVEAALHKHGVQLPPDPQRYFTQPIDQRQSIDATFKFLGRPLSFYQFRSDDTLMRLVDGDTLLAELIREALEKANREWPGWRPGLIA